MTLSERLSSASPEMQRELLTELATTVWGRDYCPPDTDPDFWVIRWNQFNRRLDCEAFESAAASMVPEGWNWMAGQRNQPIARAFINNGELAFVGFGTRRNPKQEWYECTASTPALALASAIAKERGL